MANQCIHSDVCRAYMKRFNPVSVRVGFSVVKVPVILSLLCPNGCDFYESVAKPDGLHFKEES